MKKSVASNGRQNIVAKNEKLDLHSIASELDVKPGVLLSYVTARQQQGAVATEAELRCAAVTIREERKAMTVEDCLTMIGGKTVIESGNRETSLWIMECGALVKIDEKNDEVRVVTPAQSLEVVRDLESSEGWSNGSVEATHRYYDKIIGELKGAQ